MDNNHTTTLTPSDIHGKDYKPIKLNGLSHADMESAINDLLQKNTELTAQLQKALQKISRLKKQRSALLDVIVKITKDDSDEDYDSDLSVGDLNSDIDSSDEYDLRKRPVQPDYDIEEDLEDEYKPKRRRTANGAGSRKPRGQKIIDVPKDENGNYILPVTIGSTTILSLGEIIPDIHFYNQNYIFPVGYASQRSYKSMVHTDKNTLYTCSIDKDDQNKPLFCIAAADAPDIVIEKPTASAAWSEVMKRSNLLRNKKFSNAVSGPEYYGLASKTTKKMIQELPGADACVGYQMVDA